MLASRGQQVGFVTKTRANYHNVWWQYSRGDSCPKGAFLVTGCDIPNHYVALVKEDGTYVIRRYVNGGDKCTEFRMFLTPSDSGVIWKPYVDRLPAGAIRCQEMGKYGNMYIGRHKGKGVGMVVSTKKDGWEFYTCSEPDKHEYIFDVLCNAPDN